MKLPKQIDSRIKDIRDLLKYDVSPIWLLGAAQMLEAMAAEIRETVAAHAQGPVAANAKLVNEQP